MALSIIKRGRGSKKRKVRSPIPKKEGENKISLKEGPVGRNSFQNYFPLLRNKGGSSKPALVEPFL